MKIRPIASSDKSQWLQLWQAYQDFYKVKIAETVTDLTWERFFDGVVPVNGFVAEESGELRGFVHFIYHYSTWTKGPYVYLQDLFTAEAARGKGVATALVHAVYAEAEKAGASRVYWLTHETNATAIRLYEEIAERSGFIQFRKIMPR